MNSAKLIMMGPAGCGKSTIGEALSKKLNCQFLDADDFHPKFNVEKMSNGHPLNDEDRAPWLRDLNQVLRNEPDKTVVMACSALKPKYRELLGAEIENIQFVYIRCSHQVLLERLQSRKGHFMKPEMLASQQSDLQLSSEILEVNGDLSIPEVVKQILNRI